MSKLKILVSLTTNDNDYQIEQANSAEVAARKLAVDMQIVYADNDAINQSTQILKAIQAAPDERPNAIVFEPVGGTALPQVARAAVSAGIGWAVLNRDATYIPELRSSTKAPVFSVSSDHVEIGRVQGRQCCALLPRGGSVLYIQGPSENSAAKERTIGMQEAKHSNIHLTMLKGQWTEESALLAQAFYLAEGSHRPCRRSRRLHGHWRAQSFSGIDRGVRARSLAQPSLSRLRWSPQDRAILGSQRPADRHYLHPAERRSSPCYAC
jgi:hypothetical protein